MYENMSCTYTATTGRPGSVLPDSTFSPTQGGVPGIWKKDVVDGEVVTCVVESEGLLGCLLKGAAQTVITQDPRLDTCRDTNPST